MELEGKRLAILVADLYEEVEFWYPYYRMKEAGAEVTILGPCLGPEEVRGKHGLPVKIQGRTEGAKSSDFQGVIIPGGYAPDLLRRCPTTLSFVREIYGEGKVTAAICHAGWVLVSAGIVKGKKATSFYSIKDDMINAKAQWLDQDVVADGNLITSRSPEDLPAFCREIISFFSR